MKIWGSLIAISLILLLSMGMVNCSKKKKWVAKIEGESISVDDFNVRFEYYLKSKYFQQPDIIPQARNSMEERKAALKEMINEQLILKEAKKMKFHEKEEVKDLIKIYKDQIILQAYLEENITKEIEVGDEEINNYYNANKREFRNDDPELALRKIKFLLMKEKYDKKVMEILDSLKNKYRIEENEESIRPIINESNIMQGTGEFEGGLPMPQIPDAKIKTTDEKSVEKNKSEGIKKDE